MEVGANLGLKESLFPGEIAWISQFYSFQLDSRSGDSCKTNKHLPSRPYFSESRDQGNP